MRICIIGKYPPIQGGVSMRTYWTAYRLAEGGHEVHVVTNAKEAIPPFRMHMRPDDWVRCEAQFSTGSLTVHWSDPVDRSQSYMPMASPFVSKLASIAVKLHAERPFDVIYSHYMEPYGVAGHLASEMTGVPHVVRMAGSDAGRLWHHPQLDTLYDHVLRSAECVIAGGAVRERAIERGVSPSQIVFGGGYALPETLFTPNGPAMNVKSLIGEFGSADPVGDIWGDFTGERNYFGVYGKLGETKGSFALLAAMQRLKLAGVDVGLIALAHGKPDVERRFRQMAEEFDLTDRILQIPFLPHWRVPEFLRGCLAVCCLEQDFPIRIHSPMVAREALLCGCCLVASKEVLRKLPEYDQLPSGYGCVAVDDVHDVDDLAQRLADIANDPAPAATVGARGHDFARRLEYQTDFPRRLNKILTAAAARKRITAAISGNASKPGSLDDPFQLTRLCADALQKNTTGKRFLTKGQIDIARARAILGAIREAAAKGITSLKPLIPAVEIEITVATAERTLGELRNGKKNKSFVPLNIRRWAIESGDFAHLLPIQNPRINIIKFNFDVSHYLASRNVDEFPVVITKRPSYVVVFAPAKGRRSGPLLVDSATARILQLTGGRLTVLEIAAQLESEEGTTSVEDSLAWIEELFRRGLIGLRDGDQDRTGILANRKSAN